MCCGGTMHVFIEPLDGARWKALDEAGRRRRRRVASALVTQLAAPGGKDVLADDECLRTGEARRDGDRFVEPVFPPERVILFTVEAWDVNCSQHITARFTQEEVAQAAALLRERIAALEAENTRLREELAARPALSGQGGL